LRMLYISPIKITVTHTPHTTHGNMNRHSNSDRGSDNNKTPILKRLTNMYKTRVQQSQHPHTGPSNVPFNKSTPFTSLLLKCLFDDVMFDLVCVDLREVCMGEIDNIWAYITARWKSSILSRHLLKIFAKHISPMPFVKSLIHCPQSIKDFSAHLASSFNSMYPNSVPRLVPHFTPTPTPTPTPTTLPLPLSFIGATTSTEMPTTCTPIPNEDGKTLFTEVCLVDFPPAVAVAVDQQEDEEEDHVGVGRGGDREKLNTDALVIERHGDNDDDDEWVSVLEELKYNYDHEWQLL